MAAPSSWLLRWQPCWGTSATALDLACGSGRNLRHLVALGLQVTGVDRDALALAGLHDLAEIIAADIEAGPWPLGQRQFDLVLVSNYLWRPLLAQIVAAVAPGGWLIYETFADGQQSIGRPARADFLLQPGELLQVCAGLRIVGYENGFETGAQHGGGQPRYVQRIAAVRPLPGETFPRHALD